jgi:competence protein ComEC
MRMTRFTMLSLAFVGVISVLLPGTSVALEVTPTASVTNAVRVRQFPDRDDLPPIGYLQPGQKAEVLEDVPYWYRVRLADGVVGYVSKGWVVEVSADSIGQPIAVHVIDVGTGDSIVIDYGDREVIIDGGNEVNDLSNYLAANNLVQGPIELVVVTHADSDHWRGLARLIGADNGVAPAYQVTEFWEPGYDRACGPLDSYDRFIGKMKTLVTAARFKRPLETFHPPASASGQLVPVTLLQLPGLTFWVLHSNAHPAGADCAYQNNNASIVLAMEVMGVRFLFTGDANGKLRDQSADVAPAHVEKALLDVEAAFPGTLKADVLKIAHHGSETSSTAAFIDKVKPRYALISASTRHQLPRPAVVERYEAVAESVLRTDVDRARNNDHILCIVSGTGKVDCNYADQME